jgi:hypothetical protein
MRPAPKRRWFAYSLRTLFVVVAVFACWLGWNVNVVRERQAVWREIVAEKETRDRGLLELFSHWGGAIPFPYFKTIQEGSSTAARLSFIRRLLGDEPHTDIKRSREEDARRTMRYFPEATITSYVGLGPGSDVSRARVDKIYLRE